MPENPASRPNPSPLSDGVHKALGELWQRSLPLLDERVTAIELATVELSGGPSEPGRIETGRSEAHKLAGVLGTFGLDRGTELARDLDEHLACPRAGQEATRLARVAAELRAVIEDGQAH